MKKMTENLKSLLFVIVLLCTTSNIFANNSEPSLKVLNSEKRVFTLIANNAKNTSVTIRIFDNQGINLLKEEVGVSKSYNLSQLPKGTYEVEVENQTAIRKYIVTTTENNLEIIENGAAKIYKPTVKLAGDLLALNMLNLKQKDVVLAINNELGEEIHAEKIQDSQAIHKNYNLSKLPAGRYSIIVKTQVKTFNLAINLK